jgi:hypothetical protein
VEQFLVWVPLLGALGVGSVIGNYVGGGRSRREVRSAIFKTVAEVETRRWSTDPDSADFPAFIAAVREMETATLIARIPRNAVQHYMILACTARGLSNDAVEFDPADHSFWGSIDSDFDTLVRDAAGVLTQHAWNPWRARMTLRWDLNELRTRALVFEDAKVRRRLADIQKQYGVLPGPLRKLPGMEPPPSIPIDDSDF